ncbi:hypothetical protein ACK56M_19325 [Pseudomonas sp. s4]|uniref:hypothetical protein n=1 Tax=Pseudomonas sp. s4 TaxID=353218 RepID=UPI00398CAB09
MAQIVHAARMGDEILHPSLIAEMVSAVAEAVIYAAATAAVAAAISLAVVGTVATPFLKNVLHQDGRTEHPIACRLCLSRNLTTNGGWFVTGVAMGRSTSSSTTSKKAKPS